LFDRRKEKGYTETSLSIAETAVYVDQGIHSQSKHEGKNVMNILRNILLLAFAVVVFINFRWDLISPPGGEEECMVTWKNTRNNSMGMSGWLPKDKAQSFVSWGYGDGHSQYKLECRPKH
jgi:hypothetical protein